MPNNPRSPRRLRAAAAIPLAIVALLAAPARAHAPAAVPAQGDSAADQIGRIETDTLVLKARERQLAVQAAIAVREQELAAGRQGRGPLAGAAGQPRVLAIEGIGQRLYATLLLPSGATVDVQRGDALAGGGRVIGIDAHTVLLETAERKRVALAAAGPAPAAYAGAAAQLPLPPARPLDQ